jgi:Putative transposase/Transposase zinc-binding domain
VGNDGSYLAPSPRWYARRRPASTVLHQVVVEHAETAFRQARDQSESGYGYPAHVEREFRRYVDCGILSRGFLRVRCAACGTDELVAFSCKGKSLCPSCAGRRMNDVALRLCDEVLPVAPYRQWVFSFPWRIRLALAYDRELLSSVLSVCMRKVFAYQRRKARGQGIADPHTLGVCFVQRFGSLLQLNPHAHAVLPDGVFTRTRDGAFAFVDLEPPGHDELETLGLSLVRAVLRVVSRRDDRARDDDPLATLAELSAPALTSATSGPRGGRDSDDPPAGRSSAKLAVLIETELGRFSIHAGTSVAADDRSGLERLVRYGARPALSHKRLSMTASGQVCYRLRKPYYTGQTQLVLDPVAFVRRLAALIPPAGQHQTRYYGALAARSAIRDHVVGLGLQPGSDPDASDASDPSPTDPIAKRDRQAEHPSHLARSSYRHRWAKLLAHVFEHQVLICPVCRGPRTIVAAVTQSSSVRTILEHLGLPTDLPQLAAARAPPQLDLADFEPA